MRHGMTGFLSGNWVHSRIPFSHQQENSSSGNQESRLKREERDCKARHTEKGKKETARHGCGPTMGTQNGLPW